jgi:hypothetical protein
MKSFKEYLTESKKTYTFRVKVAGECTSEHEDKLKKMLERFSVASFKKSGKTPIQSLPLDFPQLKNVDVSIYEVTLEYPTTTHELHEYISSNLGKTRQHVVVRSPNEPIEEYQQPADAPRAGALLDDPDYKEATNAKFSDFYGEDYNKSFLATLSAEMKQRRTDRGEKIPTGESTGQQTDASINTKSLLVQAQNPRK